jgi:cystathionine beta-lyase family protein involved in aluminum resistance
VGSFLPIPERMPWRTIGVAFLIVCLAGAGIGGYVIGNSPEVDLDAVRSTAAAEGRQAGTATGIEEGYAQGFKAAQKRTYGPAYASAYKEAYAAEFESVGLDPPKHIPVPNRR